jgi:hypothetical protein
MNVTAPATGARTIDPQLVKEWAAEDVAIAMGLLRECPYHGEPFRPRSIASTAKALATGFIDPLDPSVEAFKGNTRELLAAIERVTGTYGDHCEVCAASDHDVFD